MAKKQKNPTLQEIQERIRQLRLEAEMENKTFGAYTEQSRDYKISSLSMPESTDRELIRDFLYGS